MKLDRGQEERAVKCSLVENMNFNCLSMTLVTSVRGLLEPIPVTAKLGFQSPFAIWKDRAAAAECQVSVLIY
jgi:hypothetical protein